MHSSGCSFFVRDPSAPSSATDPTTPLAQCTEALRTSELSPPTAGEGDPPVPTSHLHDESEPPTPSLVQEIPSATCAMPASVPLSSSDGGRALQSHYALDGASPLPALALAPRRGHRVLDLCAAPGGKSLCLAAQLFYERSDRDHDGGGRDGSDCNSILISNDRSGPRRARLRRVLEEYLPSDLICEPSELPAHNTGAMLAAVTGIDAAQWGRGPAAPAWSAAGSLDRILVDAPCSSERHFLHGSADATWSRARLKRDAALQGAIMRNASRLLAVGGRLVYSTCSLADEENDAVVAKLLAHKRHGAGLVAVDALDGLREDILKPLLQGVSRTRLGAIMLPDSSRFGPLYWAVIERRGAAVADAAASSDEDCNSDAADDEGLESGLGEDADDY